MPVCPSGHDSAADDYCDTCGIRIGGAPAPAPPPTGSETGSAVAATPAAPATPVVPGTPAPAEVTAGESCPSCQAPRTGRFCEVCGYDFVTGGGGAPPATAAAPPPAPVSGVDVEGGAAPASGGAAPTGGGAAAAAVTWTAVVTADRAYFDAVVAREGPDAAAMTFPPYCPERRIPLVGREVRIGRRSRSRGVTPEIDLAGPPEDPGVSHLHAVLLAQPDGGWAVVDVGSTNGTTVNGGADPIASNVPVPLADGDRVHVGAWTTITLRAGT